MKRNLLLCNGILVCFICISQYAVCQFTYKADIGAVKQSGFHKILLTPALSAKSNPDFSDIRIIDETGKALPYILNRDQPVFNENELRVFPVVSTTKTRDSNTQIILEAGFDNILITEQENYSFVVVMKKADAYRNASLSGGNNLKQWFSISDRIMLDAGNNHQGSEYTQVILIPPGNYHYLKIVMDDKGLQPLNIVKAGLLLNKSTYGNYTMLPAPRLLQKDSSNRKSYIGVHFDDFYPISKMRFSISQPALYKRKIYLYDTSGVQSRRVADGVAEPEMDSLMLSGEKIKDFVLVIENNDDQPMRLDSIKAYQLRHFIIANLQQGKKYSILTGHNGAATPMYDLRFFTDSIKIVSEKELVPGIPVSYETDKPKEIRRNAIPFVWIWVAIGIVLFSLLWLTYRLIKDISNRKQ